jgi:hypothetical protein
MPPADAACNNIGVRILLMAIDAVLGTLEVIFGTQ